MKGHPVYLLLPAFPCPCGHRVAEGAVVEVVAVVGGTDMRLLTVRQRQVNLCEVNGKLVPTDVDMCVVVEIPVHTRRHGQHAATFDAGFSVGSTDGKGVGAVLCHSRLHGRDKTRGRTLTTYAVKECGQCRALICPQRQGCNDKEAEKEKTIFHNFHPTPSMEWAEKVGGHRRLDALLN